MRSIPILICAILFLLGGDPRLGRSQPEVKVARPEVVETSPLPAPSPMMLELGAFGGAFLPSPRHELYDSTQSFHSSFRRVGPKAGLRLGFFPLELLGVELEGGYAPLVNERGESNHLFDFRGQAIVQLPWRVSPFATLGGGFLGVQGERGGDLDGALHYGAGVKVFATSELTFRLDAKHIVSGAEGPGEGNTHHFEVTMGVGVVLFRQAQMATVTGRSVSPPIAVFEPPPLVLEEREVEEEPVQAVVVGQTLYVETVEPVLFCFDCHRLAEGFVPLLKEVVTLMKARADLDVVVVGHADAVGPAEYNLILSERRARAVELFLVRRGVQPVRIRVSGVGEGAPIASNATEGGRAKNRRTEITVVERRASSEAVLEAQAAPFTAPE